MRRPWAGVSDYKASDVGGMVHVIGKKMESSSPPPRVQVYCVLSVYLVVILCQAQRPKGLGELLANQATPTPAKLKTLQTRSQKPALE